METDAYRAVSRLCARWNDRNRAHDLLAPDFVRRDRRPLIGLPDAGREAMAAVEDSMWEMGAVWPVDAEELVHVEGERMIVTLSTVSFGSGAETRYLTLVRLDAGGLIDRLYLYEPEQRDLALADAAELMGSSG